MFPENKNPINLDQAPQPATPEELEGFKDLVISKVKGSDKAVVYKDPITDIDAIASKWVPEESIDVHAEISPATSPASIDILVTEQFGQVQGIDTVLIKHFRYFPNTGGSEYDEEPVEFYKGKRLFGEELQRAREIALKEMENIDEDSLDEDKKHMIEHAREFRQKFSGSTAPPLDRSHLQEITSLLNQCDSSNEDRAPTFV